MLASQKADAAPRRPRGRPKLHDIAAIDRVLIEVALKEFLRNGYGATSMARIVKAAGISKTTLYARFASKGELFRAIMREQVDGLAEGAEQSLHLDAVDLEAGLKSYANHMLKMSLEGDLLDVNRLIYSESSRFPELGLAAAERSQVGVGQVAEFIRECAAADDIPCTDPIAVAEAFIFMLRGWYVDVMLTNRPVSAAVRRKWVDRAVRSLIAGRDEW